MSSPTNTDPPIYKSFYDLYPNVTPKENLDPNIYTKDYNCNTIKTVYENYKNKNKDEINKLKLITLLTDPECRVFDTIGPNKNDPEKWVIPDGEFRPFLTELGISEPYNQNIKTIITERQKAKSLTYQLTKLTSGKGGKIKSRTKRKRSKSRKTKRRSRKSRKHYKKRR